MSSASLDLVASQKESLIEVLKTTVNEGKLSKPNNYGLPWKVLVYDERGEMILAPILKVSDLRMQGVTLYVKLKSTRTPVRDVPALYLIEPTEENIALVCNDLRNKLYWKFIIEFIRPASPELLLKLAQSIISIGVGNASMISKVVDRYVDFISLMQNDFCLGVPKAFSAFYSTASSESLIQRNIDRIVSGILSVLVTVGVLPLIVAPNEQNSAAKAVAISLQSAMKEYLSFDDDSSSSLRSRISGRPVLLLTDRASDLFVMLSHPWTYRSLVHDIFRLRLNQVKIPKSVTNKDVDTELSLDPTDQFWVTNYCKPFPDAAAAVPEALADFNLKMNSISGNTGDNTSAGGVDSASAVSDAVDAIPEMTLKKRWLDLHTTIASGMMQTVKKRQLYNYFELESSMVDSVTFNLQSSSALFSSVHSVVSNSDVGTVTDKARLILCFHLASVNNPDVSEQVDALIKEVEKIYESDSTITSLKNAIKFIRRYEGLVRTSNTMAISKPSNPSLSSASGQLFGSQAALWGSKVIDRSRGFLLQGVKQFIPPREEWAVLKHVTQLTDLRNSSIPNGFATFEYRDGSRKRGIPELPATQVIVFAVGGGSFVESAALHSWAEKNNREVVYGCTDFSAGEDFLSELAELGAQL